MRDYIIDIMPQYENVFGASRSLDAFRVFMASQVNIASRANLLGHVTGSALVRDKKSDTVLRIYHTKVKRWVFSAGGHIDEGEMPWQAAQRELREETGIDASFVDTRQPPMPLLFDAHPIPASIKKSEPAHWHYDLLYLFAVNGQPDIKADPAEIERFHWVNVAQVTMDNSPIDLPRHMLRYLDEQI